MLSDSQLAMQFEDIKRILRNADHMVYITYPVLKENRLLVKVLEEVHEAVKRTINIIMGREYECKRIKLYSDYKINMAIFEQKCAPRYYLSQDEMTGIRQIMDLFESHKSSPMEFSRQNKFIIMSDNLKTDSITVQRLKSMLGTAKLFARKAQNSLILKTI
jgi:hypothetical protein